MLPHRIHWIASPQLPRSKVAKVEFLIDGRLGWVEHHAPYVYGDDGNWLVTSFLKPGRHVFTVRVVALGGQTATSTTNSTVIAPPTPPSALAHMAADRHHRGPAQVHHGSRAAILEDPWTRLK